jgi:sulfate adenylyltransferase large subunit
MATTELAPVAAAPGLLRFTTCGSVDDGKSTLIGRLLHDSKSIYEDQIESVRRRPGGTSGAGTGGLDLALLTDGLRAEREQGITIDVAYRYFSTPRRSFIIADTPGHEQYTRNMATGASTADAAIVLLDASKGVLTQSRRHAHIARLLGIPCLIAAVNKMDLMDYRQDVFEAIAADFRAFAARLGWPRVYALPVSALAGDNVVARSPNLAWFDGPPLLEYLETAPLAAASAHQGPLRFPVQMVLRGSDSADLFRGFAGEVASGTVRRGDRVRVFNAGTADKKLEARVDRIVTFDGDLDAAPAGAAVTITLDRELDIGRGDILAPAAEAPLASARRFRARLVWMDTTASQPGTLYWLHHATRAVRARLAHVEHRVDVNTLEPHPASHLNANDIAQVEIDCRLPLAFDAYEQNRRLGAFILIDPATNATAAAGMIEGPLDDDRAGSALSEEDRRRRWGHPALGVWLGDDAALAIAVERALDARFWNVVRVETTAFDPSQLTAIATVLRAAGAVALFAGASDAARREAAAAAFAAPEWLTPTGDAAAIIADLEQRAVKEDQ